MISTRLQQKADGEGLISKNQIGFWKGYLTADHLLTLQALVKKYVTKGGGGGGVQTIRMFCRPKKAFDSIGHIRLFNHL